MPIERVPAPIRQQVEEAVRGEILEGVLPPGSRLVERDLCERFAVSRPVVREAFRQLEAEGLLTHGPNGRVRVASLRVEDVAHIYDMRCLLEPFAARQFVRNASEAERSALRRAVEAMEGAILLEDTSNAIRHKNVFYSVLAAGSGNPVLEQTLRRLQNRIRLLRGASMSVPGRLPNTAREIRAILDAVISGDARTAERLCLEHLHHAGESTRRALAYAAAQEAQEVQ